MSDHPEPTHINHSSFCCWGFHASCGGDCLSPTGLVTCECAPTRLGFHLNKASGSTSWSLRYVMGWWMRRPVEPSR